MERLKILCLFSTQTDIPVGDPVLELEPHEVVLAGTLVDASRKIWRAVKPFDIVLADVEVPYSKKEPSPANPVMLTRALSQRGVHGLGMFFPADVDGAVLLEQGEHFALVSVNDCWTEEGKRDWPKLLDKVQEKIH